MREIKFTDENFAQFQQKKRTTIRLGQKDYKIHESVLLSSDNHGCQKAVISEIKITTIGQLTLAEISGDGFHSLSKLKEELELCYAIEIGLGEVITVITFAHDNKGLL